MCICLCLRLTLSWPTPPHHHQMASWLDDAALLDSLHVGNRHRKKEKWVRETERGVLISSWPQSSKREEICSVSAGHNNISMNCSSDLQSLLCTYILNIYNTHSIKHSWKHMPILKTSTRTWFSVWYSLCILKSPKMAAYCKIAKI